jgi:SAM-dependent methyltransferase
MAPAYTCLWCGVACPPTAADDLTALARLCPDCLARAGDNPFLRRRLHAAIEARARMPAQTTPVSGETAAPPMTAASAVTTVAPAPAARVIPATAAQPAPTASLAPAPATLATPLSAPPDDPDLLDDWYLGRGRYDRGPIPGAAWLAQLEAAVARVDAAGLTGRIVEPRCGVGFWSVLLASAGELTALDDRPAMADRATARLVAHGLRAHVHVADPASPPGPEEAAAFDGAFLGFALSRLAQSPRDAVVAATRARLRAGGRLVVVDLGRPGIDEAHLRAAFSEHLIGMRLLDAAAAGPDLVVAVAERDGS